MHSPRPQYHRFLLPILLVVSALPYVSLPGSEFVLTDDGNNIYRNPLLHPVTASSMAAFWRTPFEHLYLPVTYTAWSLLTLLAHLPHPIDTPGMGVTDLDPAVYHAANLLLHLTNVALVFALLRRVVRMESPMPAFCGALLFAVHPLQTEPVAWASSLDVLLATTLSLTATLLYVRFLTTPRPPASPDGNAPAAIGAYVAATICFLLAALAKPTVAAMPIAVGALAVLTLRQSIARVAASLVPWLPISAMVGIRTVTAASWTASGWHYAVPVWQRPFIAGDALAFYLAKLVFPVYLCFDYGRSPHRLMEHRWACITWLAPIVLLAAFWHIRRTECGRTLLGAYCFFVCALLPTLGFTVTYFQPFSTVADRYAYLAMVGAALAVAAGLSAAERGGALVRRPAYGAVAAFLAFCVVQTGLLAQAWANSGALYSRILDVNPDSVVAYSSLPTTYLHEQQVQPAIDAYKRAVALDPDSDRIRIPLARLLQSQNDASGAEAEYRAALRTTPGDAEARCELGMLVAGEGRLPEAETLLQQAVDAAPSEPTIRCSLAAVLAQGGDRTDAIREFQQALAIDPGLARAQQMLGALQRAQRAGGGVR